MRECFALLKSLRVNVFILNLSLMLRRSLSMVISRRVKDNTLLLSERLCTEKVVHKSEPEFDYEYLLNPENRNEIEDNIKRRNSCGNLNNLINIYNQFENETDASKREILLKSLKKEASNIPNKTHPKVRKYKNMPEKIKCNDIPKFNFVPKEFHDLAKELNLLRTEELTTLTGRRSYFFVGDLAELEHALVKYTLSNLIKRNFKLISVPDILSAEIIENCGMKTSGERQQIFQLDDASGQNLCLSGTSEMGLASLYSNTVFNEKDLPLCLAAVSRCHRAELSSVQKEKGIFRVHNFTKVEMYGLSHPNESEQLFHKFVNIQEDIFKSLGLHFHILDMPMEDLGASTYRKFDIEAWFPGRKLYGEISSCSNCTDYQARRLNIRFKDNNGIHHIHTVNGTACAIPRMVMAIFEAHQLENGNINIPLPLRRFYQGEEEIGKKVRDSAVKQELESRSI